MVIVRVLKYLAVLVCAIGSGNWAEAGQAPGGSAPRSWTLRRTSRATVIKLISDVVKGVAVM